MGYGGPHDFWQKMEQKNICGIFNPKKSLHA